MTNRQPVDVIDFSIKRYEIKRAVHVSIIIKSNYSYETVRFSPDMPTLDCSNEQLLAISVGRNYYLHPSFKSESKYSGNLNK